MIALGVLDQSPVRPGATPAQAIAETIVLAKACDAWGYRRYWLAEHHNTQGLAGTAPEILIARVAAETRAIRVGSGGVMLSHYASLKVAEVFRTLEALYPGRIDLGVGRAPGSDPIAAMALRPGASSIGAEDYPNQVADLLGFLGGKLADGHPFAGVRAMPAGPTVPEVWLLGSTDQSAALAAYLGCPFSFAHFINDRGGEDVIAAYRETFRPSPWAAEPTASVCVFVICADGEEEALKLEASRNLWRLRFSKTGEIGPYPTVAEALLYPYTDADRALIERARRRNVVGTAEQVKARLEAMGRDFGVGEIMIVTICPDFEARLRSYELLARAFALAPRS